ncbi:MAG: NAD-dependent epimerase, partial [Gammaproteobacteria bacterium]
MKVLLTGAAGFIGMHTALRLLARGDQVVGVDNLNDYYDVVLKEARLARLAPHTAFRFQRLGIEQRDAMAQLFAAEQPDAVVHLAAQAGVRYSLQNPQAYVDANLQGFMNVLEGCRQHPVRHLVYASSSSVYGGNAKLPFSEQDPVDRPVSLYAATKKANELMAHTYSHLFRIPTTGLRFFTVYGPWGRPDMSPMLFARAILAGQPIQVFNHGHMSRDFTYIDDIVEGVVRVLDKPATPDEAFNPLQPNPSTSNAPYRVFNIGNHTPTPLMQYIAALEATLGRPAIKQFLPMQPGDVRATAANTNELNAWVGFKPNTPVEH